jgi:surfactin synthase thioesterase subunit
MMKKDAKTIEAIRKSNRQNAQVAANKKLRKTILGLVKSNAEIYNKFQQDELQTKLSKFYF